LKQCVTIQFTRNTFYGFSTSMGTSVVDKPRRCVRRQCRANLRYTCNESTAE